MSDSSSVKLKKSTTFYRVLSLFAFFGFLGIGSFTYKSNNNETSRSISSISNKSSILKYKNVLIPRTQKLTHNIDLSILSDQDESIEANVPFTLTAQVSSWNNINNLKGQWVLPSEIQIVSGEQEISGINLTAKQKESFQIVLTSNTDINTKIHFIVKSEDPNRHFSQVVQFNTIDEKKIVNSKQELLQRTKDYLDEQNNHQKVHQ